MSACIFFFPLCSESNCRLFTVVALIPTSKVSEQLGKPPNDMLSSQRWHVWLPAYLISPELYREDSVECWQATGGPMAGSRVVREDELAG